MKIKNSLKRQEQPIPQRKKEMEGATDFTVPQEQKKEIRCEAVAVR
jgi:hypothetical protein